MTAVAAEAAVVVDNSRETSGETSLWHGAAAGAAARVDPLLRRIRGLTRFDQSVQNRHPVEEKRPHTSPYLSFYGRLYGGNMCNVKT